MANSPTRRTVSTSKPAAAQQLAADAVTPIPSLQCPTTPYSFAKDIVGMFTQTDISCMSWRFDLSSYTDVSNKRNAAAIYDKVASGQMPKHDSGEPPWTTEMVTKFGCWVQQGRQP